MNEQDRDELLVRIDERVLAIQEDLKTGERRMNDHTRRLRKLEIWRGGIVTGLTLLGLAVAILVKVIF